MATADDLMGSDSFVALARRILAGKCGLFLGPARPSPVNARNSKAAQSLAACRT